MEVSSLMSEKTTHAESAMASHDDAASSRIQWHQGFYGGIELELREWKDVLSFSREHEISKGSILADMLVIKKKPDVVIDNSIARQFRTHNILEYKSPSDTLSIDGYYRGLAYAYYYKSNGETENAIPLRDVTYTACCVHHPRALFSEFEESHIKIVKNEDGIYTIDRNPDTINSLLKRVVVISELPHGSHLALRILQPGADLTDIQEFLKEASAWSEQGDQDNLRTVLQISMMANADSYKRLKKEGHMYSVGAAARYIFSEEFEAERTSGKVEGKAEKTNEFITRMLRQNEPVERIMAYTDASRDTISHIAKSIGIQLAC